MFSKLPSFIAKVNEMTMFSKLLSSIANLKVSPEIVQKCIIGVFTIIPFAIWIIGGLSDPIMASSGFFWIVSLLFLGGIIWCFVNWKKAFDFILGITILFFIGWIIAWFNDFTFSQYVSFTIKAVGILFIFWLISFFKGLSGSKSKNDLLLDQTRLVDKAGFTHVNQTDCEEANRRIDAGGHS